MDKFINNMKIKTKLMIIYLFVTVSTVLIIGTYFIDNMSKIIIENTKKEAKYNALRVKESFDETLRLAISTSDMIFKDEKLHNIIKKKYDNYGDVVKDYNEYPIIHNYLNYYEGLSRIRLYVENDTLLDNSEITKVTDKVKANKWYQDASEKNGIILWNYTKDGITDDYNLNLIREIVCSEHGQIGVIAVSINDLYLKKIINQEVYPITILVDGIVIASKHFPTGEMLEENYNEENVSYFVDRDKEFSRDNEYIITNKFKVDKSFENIFEVRVNIPMSSIMRESIILVRKSIFIILIVISVSLIFIVYFSKKFSKRVSLLTNEMNKVVDKDFDIIESIGGNDEFTDLHNNLYIMVDSIKKLINEVYVKELQEEQFRAKQKDIEFKMLASQINPHFLYNTLETIRMRSLCSGDIELANIVRKLGKIMRRSLEVANEEVYLNSELEFTQDYLEIQSLRFQGKVEYRLDVNINIEKYRVLPLLIQPIVENAFIHGLENSMNKGSILISVTEKNKKILIEVSDNGIGIDDEGLKTIRKSLSENCYIGKKSIGISNVNERIKILYGQEFGLYIFSQLGVGTKVQILLPVREDKLSYD